MPRVLSKEMYLLVTVGPVYAWLIRALVHLIDVSGVTTERSRMPGSGRSGESGGNKRLRRSDWSERRGRGEERNSKIGRNH